jgi:hypothetical protein
MRIPNSVAREIVERVLTGEDYRPVIVQLIDTEFLNYVLDFFRQIVDAKLDGQRITGDWYRERMLLRGDIPKEEVATRAGLNLKTIHNARHTTRRKVVEEEALKHYEKLRQVVEELIQDDQHFGVEITLKLRGVSVTLDVAESLIVINALAVARAALRGGAWSTAGKQVEEPLMQTLCALHRVPKKYYDQKRIPKSERETDFCLLDTKGKVYRCEVKLLGKGNPESADAPLAREVQIFIADTISDKMKAQLDSRGVLWMELRGAQDWQKFTEILNKLGIPHKPVPQGKEKEWLERCLNAVIPIGSTYAAQIRETPADYSSEGDLLVELE